MYRFLENVLCAAALSFTILLMIWLVIGHDPFMQSYSQFQQDLYENRVEQLPRL